MRRITFLLVLVGLLTVGVGQAAADGGSQAFLRYMERIGKRITTMAEDFPEDKYDYKPTPEVRSFAEQMLHIASANYGFMTIARGEKPDFPDLSRENYPTKAAVVAEVKKSFAECIETLREAGDAGLAKEMKWPFGDRMTTAYEIWLLTMEHGAEHYGQLVVYYRNNGLVPPASRRQQ